MSKYVIAVHGGAGPDSAFIRGNQEANKRGIEAALNKGYEILGRGGSALDAVEAAVNTLEDDPLFNAGRGSALNEHAEVEMDAAIVDGKDLRMGAVAIVKHVKNPVSLAKAVIEQSAHVYLGGEGALEFAEKVGLEMMPEAYFVTDHAFEQYQEAMKTSTASMQEAGEFQARLKTHGTVGAVALDTHGNVAAATSTGGTENKVPGRIADSSMVGVGTYANNKTCAVSATGDGEYIMQHVLGFHLASLIEFREMPLREAAHFLLQEKLKDVHGDMGIIAVDRHGNVALEFNSERMPRGYKSSTGETEIRIYRE